MDQEHFAAVAHEDDTDAMATIGDFAFEELEDRLELGCWDCHSHDGVRHCIPMSCF